MRGRLAQISLTLVALLVGVLIVGQLRSQTRPAELSSLSAQELSTRIETLSAANRQLRDGLADVLDQLREYRPAGAQGQSALNVSREELRRVTAFGGLGAVTGQGIRLTINGSMDEIAVNDLLNELRNAGAEALAVDNVRITARSVAVPGPRSLEVDGVAIGRQFTISAVGDPDGLIAALERPGGIISQLELFASATIGVTEVNPLRLPATALHLTPEAAEPVQ